MFFLVFFLFQGIVSLEPIGLPGFRHDLDLFVMILVKCSTRTSNHVGVFSTSVYDFVTLFALMNASNN